jgi:TPR repeat protein
MLAESFLVKSGGDLGVDLGERKRHAIRHNWNFSLFSLLRTGGSTRPEVQIQYTESGTNFSEDLVIGQHRHLAWILICTFVPQLAAGQAVTIDPDLLAKANAGDATAEVQVGEHYAHAAAVEQNHSQVAEDYQQAAAWYRKAAEQKSIEGALHLAALYRDGGNGFPRDMEQAAAWYLKAADQGDVGAQGTLGVLYSMGQGVAQDNVEAYFWLDLAASIKGPDQEKYAANRQMIGERITADELAAVQDRVAAWKAAHPQPNSNK